MAKKSEKAAFVCHCVVNQSTRAWWGDGSASRENGMISDAISVPMNNGVGVIQMECPEFGP